MILGASRDTQFVYILNYIRNPTFSSNYWNIISFVAYELGF
jgi:hypothetical protein